MAIKPEKLRGMGEDDLRREEEQLREEIWKLRLQLSHGQMQDPSRVRRARRDLARVLTIRNERAAVAAEGGRPSRRS